MVEPQAATMDFKPPWNFEQETRGYRPLAEIEKVETASASGDLTTVRTIFESPPFDRTLAERVELDYLAGSFSAALENNQLSVATYLLSKGVPINIYHFTLAIELKSYSFLQLFLDYGWDINTPIDSANPPPLMLALHDEKLTEWFLSHGADPNAECGSGLDLTPLSVAVSEAPFAVILLLFAHGGSVEHGQLLHYAVRRNSTDRVKVLEYIINKGAPINNVMYQNRLGCYYHQMAFGVGTPLHEAAEEGKLEMVELLLSRGADPLIKNARGRLAIERAERYGHTAIVERLRALSASSDSHHNFTDGRRVEEQ